MKLQGWSGVLVLGVLALAAVTSCAPRPERRAAAAADDPLRAGWQFACAITNDAKDRAMCQELVASAHLVRGEFDKALELGERIENWRKGVVLAEAAAVLAEKGKTNEALERAGQAETMAREIQDWQRDRILARVVKTKALLGREEEVSRWSRFYGSNRDYRGEVVTYQALALAQRGLVTNALAALDGLADTTYLDVSSWRAHGYMLLAKAGHLDAAQTSNVLAQAWAATERIPGSKRWDVQMDLAEAALARGEAALARVWLDGVSSNVLTGEIPAHLKAPLTAKLAVRWGVLGQDERLAECERVAEPLIRQLQAIEQPALFAVLGEAWARLGDTQKASTYYEHAVELAGQLTNLRPRAMACVDICLSLERARLRHRPVSEGLNRLLAGFGATHD